MKTCRSFASGTPANASWRATPLPQSITYAVSFATITCADAELAFRGRGPPPVPRRISLVLALCPSPRLGNHAALASAAAQVKKARRFMPIPLRAPSLEELNRPLMSFGGRPRREGPQIAALPSPRILGPRVQPILT